MGGLAVARLAQAATVQQLADFLDAKLIALAASGDQLKPLQASSATLVTSDVLPAHESLDEVMGDS